MVRSKRALWRKGSERKPEDLFGSIKLYYKLFFISISASKFICYDEPTEYLFIIRKRKRKGKRLKTPLYLYLLEPFNCYISSLFPTSTSGVYIFEFGGHLYLLNLDDGFIEYLGSMADFHVGFSNLGAFAKAFEVAGDDRGHKITCH